MIKKSKQETPNERILRQMHGVPAKSATLESEIDPSNPYKGPPRLKVNDNERMR